MPDVDSLIHHIAMTRSGNDLFATGTADEQVTVWSFQSHKRISELSTVLDFGGYRLGLACGLRPIVVAGSWEKGAAAYEASTGQRLWSRRDLKYVQHVRDLSNGNFQALGIGLEEGAYHIVDAETGEDKSRLSNAIKVYASPFDPHYLLVGADKTVHLSAEFRLPAIWRKSLNSFAVLHAAFSPTEVAYSETGRSVYCFDFYGTEVWRLQPEPDHHILRIAWDSALQRWLAIKRNFQHGGPVLLLEIDSSGSTRVIANVGDRWLVEFFPSGRHIVTANGVVFSTETGKAVWDFADSTVVSRQAT